MTRPTRPPVDAGKVIDVAGLARVPACTHAPECYSPHMLKTADAKCSLSELSRAKRAM